MNADLLPAPLPRPVGGGEPRCGGSVDGLHCPHWYDGDGCCACGTAP
jgi:hypothetical protein